MNITLHDGWQSVVLDDITVCLDEKRIPLNSEERYTMKGNIPYYGANGQIDSINKNLFDEELLLLAEDGGSWSMNQNCAYIINGKSWVNNHAHVLRMKKDVDISYLMYFLNYTDLDRFISGTTRGKLNQGIMKKIPIILPPIQVQKELVLILKKVEKVKKLRDEAYKMTKDFPNAIFLEMFGDPILNINKLNRKNLDQLTERIVVGHVGQTSNNYCEKGIKFVRTQNVRRNKINYNDLQYITPEFHKKLKKSMIFENDVLISRVGVNRGMAAAVPKDLDGANCANVVIIGRSPKLNSIYLSYYLNMTYGKKPEFGYSVGSAQGVVNTSIVKKWPLIVAPLSLQNKFASIVKEIERVMEHQKQSKDMVNNIFNNLTQKSFNGELAC